MIATATHYRESTDLERRLESIALTCLKMRLAGERLDLSFVRAARAMGLDDYDAIVKIRQRAHFRYKTIRRLPSHCIFAEADRIANLKPSITSTIRSTS